MEQEHASGARDRRGAQRKTHRSQREPPGAAATSAARALACVCALALAPAAASWAMVPVGSGAAGSGAAGPATAGAGTATEETGPAAAPGAGDPATVAAAASATGPASVTGSDDGPPPALGAVGMGGGFPSFQTAAPYLSVQAQYVGFQVKGSLTPVGPYLGLELRGYPPVPLPVPLFVGLGGGFYGGQTTVFGTLGAHVPLSLHVRLDVEAGAANVPLLAGRAWAPYLSLGVSYAFPFTPTEPRPGFEAAAPVTLGGEAGATCAEPTAPDESLLPAAFRRTLQGFLDSARATYGSVYTGLRYSYDITSLSVSGDVGRVQVHYSGSVRTIASGRTESASGSASASYHWSGCSWAQRSVSY